MHLLADHDRTGAVPLVLDPSCVIEAHKDEAVQGLDGECDGVSQAPTRHRDGGRCGRMACVQIGPHRLGRDSRLRLVRHRQPRETQPGYGSEQEVNSLIVLESRQTSLPIPWSHDPEAVAGPLGIADVDGTQGPVVRDLQRLVVPKVRMDASDRVPVGLFHVGTQQNADMLPLDLHRGG